ncbi:MAG TPA: M15 family metallopeptidase [Micromonosporaceae bacterium]
MPTSQNGWKASRDKAAIGIVSPRVAGVDFPGGVRGGDVATVLMYVATQFDRRVEPLHAGWCWGYAYKQIEGSSTLSNHASGTAIDINAPDHPMGRRGTFSGKQVREIHKILAECEGVVRWGGDYSGRPDEMHFEINRPPKDVARVAAKIRRGEGDMPTAKEIAEAVWGTDDIVPAPWPVRTADNEYWTPGTTLHHGLGHAIDANRRITELLTKVDGLTAILTEVVNRGSNLDTAAVMSRLDELAGRLAAAEIERDTLRQRLAEALAKKG